MADYFIGIDGGGSNCRAALADRTGTVFGRGVSGASNIFNDADAALRHIVEAVNAAFAEAGLRADAGAAHAVLGLAGANIDGGRFAARLPFARASVVSDALIALEGAFGGGDGAIGIIGTGSVFLIRGEGRVQSLGGWGFRLSDLGSGARLGQAALQEALLAHDGIRPMTELLRDVLGQFDGRPENIVAFAQTASTGDFARLAPKIFAFCEKGDEAAVAIVTAAASSLDAALDAVAKRQGADGRLCLLGGLAVVYRPLLAERHRRNLVEPLGDALAGAVAMALRTDQEGG